MNAGNAERLAAIAVRDAARELACDASGEVARAYRMLASQIGAAIDDPHIDARTLAGAGADSPGRVGRHDDPLLLRP